MSQGAWTDIYALSAVIHVVITGRAPPLSVARILNDRYMPLAGNAELQQRFSNHILAAVDSGLGVRPEERPQSVSEFRSALNLQSVNEPGAAQPARSISARPSEPTTYPSNVAKPASVASPSAKNTSNSMLAATATTLAIAAAGAWWWTNNSTTNSGATNAPASQAATVIAPSAVPPQAAPIASQAPVQTVNASQSLSSWLVSAKPGFEVTAKPSQPEARIGKDKLGFQIQSNKSGFVHVYLLSPGGDMFLLFPIVLDKRNRIEPGTPLSLPKPSWAMDPGGHQERTSL